jgi:hypothetical protein
VVRGLVRRPRAGRLRDGGFIAGNTVKVSNAKYRGPADANGVAEIRVWARRRLTARPTPSTTQGNKT